MTPCCQRRLAKKWGADELPFSGMPHNLMNDTEWPLVAEGIEQWMHEKVLGNEGGPAITSDGLPTSVSGKVIDR